MGNQNGSLSSPSSMPSSPSRRQNGLSSSMVNHHSSQDDGDVFEVDTTTEVEASIPDKIERLELENQMLRDRCDRLEAQTILVSVQQLDCMAQGMAWCLYLSSIWLIGKLVNTYLVHRLDGWLLAYLHHQFCWVVTCDLTCNVIFDCQAQDQKQLLVVMQWLWVISKYITGFGLVYLYHRRTRGLDLRRFQVFAVALVIFARIKLCRWREQMFVTSRTMLAEGTETSSPTVAAATTGGLYGAEMSEEAIWDANYEVSARFLYISFLRLRGLWTKTAQYLSSRADFVPTAYVRELSKLQDQAPATAWNEIVQEHILSSSLLQILDVDPVPIASASIGQVHVAHIKKSREKVVVKVQHPFAKTLLLDDFRSLAMICRVWSFLEPEYKFFEVLMQEWATEARKELDFLQEAQNLVEAQASLDDMKRHEDQPYFVTNIHSVPYDVEIPQPMLSLCTRKVLVMSFCEGVRIDKGLELDRTGVSKDDVMESVAQTFAHFMYNGTIFNGDPHPGNLFLRPGMRHENQQHQNQTATKQSRTKKGFTLVLLDWGLAKRLPPTKRVAFAQMAYAAATIDFGLLLDSFDLLGLKMKREDVHQDMDAIRFLLRELAPRIIAQRRIKAKFRRNQEKLESKKRGERVSFESKAYPGEFFFFVRVNELLHGLGSRLQVYMNYLDIIKPFAERALLQNKSSASDPIDPLPIADMALNRKVASVLNQLEATEKIAGAQVCVVDAKGNAVVDLVVGHMGGFRRQHPMRYDTLILGFSCTKAITATLVHMMVADGYLTPDEPICERVWRNFCPTEYPPPALYAALNDTLSKIEIRQRWIWKRKITLRHILTHSAGLWSALPHRLTIQRLSSCESCVAAFEYDAGNPADTLLPHHAPGEKGEYHFLSFGWLVAGVVCGAYKERHSKACTFEEVYQAIMVPKLSAITLSAGFQPMGCRNDDDIDSMALVEIENSKTRLILQVEREAESMGEVNIGGASPLNEEGNRFGQLLPALKGQEFLIDPRIWNCKTARKAVCPAAGGRFSARGLAYFYHDLGCKLLLCQERIDWASGTHMVIDFNQGQAVTMMTMTHDAPHQRDAVFGLGYQLMGVGSNDASATPKAFGHSGIGGSVGFHHKPSGVSVAIMLNKMDGDKESTKKILETIAGHFGW